MLTPSLSPLPRACRIVDVTQENATTCTLTLDASMDAQPGQFVMAWLPDHGEKPFSLAGVDPVRLTVAAVGPFSAALCGLRVGERVWLRGPLGRGYTLPAPKGAVVLVGGGYGVAPLRLLAERLLPNRRPLSMIIGARSAEQLLVPLSLAEAGVALWLATEDGSAGVRGRVIDALPLALGAYPRRGVAMVYACGPIGMLQAVAAFCAARGLPVQLGWEAPMRCGIGLCGSCEVGEGWLACLDGPVFAFDPTLTAPA